MERRQCETENLVRGRLDDRDNVLKEIWNRVHDMFADALRCTLIAGKPGDLFFARSNFKQYF